ncbi:MAG: DHH family phosphoesterase [Deltaproteobacteria bacterium]|nr:DHH family phosphoesterase [Deltaproteobacteria bacterium]
MSAIRRFEEQVARVTRTFLDARQSRVVVLHHNDCDGLSSAAILFKTFERAQVPYSGYALEKPYPAVLDRLFKELDATSLFLFADFASGMLPEISRLNVNGSPVFVLDHHSITPSNDTNIHLLNCTSSGLEGGECSSSVICFIFSMALHDYNTDLSSAALLGALGDKMFDRRGLLYGVNGAVFEKYKGLGAFGYDSNYWIETGGRKEAQLVTRFVDALGSFGYLKGGPDIAIKGIQQGFSEPFVFAARQYLDQFEKDYQAFSKDVTFTESGNIAAFETEDRFIGYGVKTVGLICERLISEGLAPGGKYLVGFQPISPMIPGLGPIKLDDLKVSVRVDAKLLSSIKRGERPSVAEILPKAAAQAGGFSDACHPHAGACTVSVSKKDELLDNIRRYSIIAL